MNLLILNQTPLREATMNWKFKSLTPWRPLAFRAPRVLFVALVGLLFIGPAVTHGADFSTWSIKLQLTFSGYDRSETLTNFPVLVKLNTSIPGFSYDDFLSPPYDDLRVTASDETTEIPYEVDTWNDTGTSYVWVQVPAVTSSTTAIWLFWGKAGQSAPAYTTDGSTWTGSYVGVWHMNNVNASDSTTNNPDGVGGSGVSSVPGLLGGATDHDGTASAGILVTNGFSSTIQNDQTHTISLWYNVRNFGDVIIDAPDLGPTGFFFQFNTTVGFYVGYGGYRTYTGMSLQANEWEHVAFVKTGSGNSGDLYLNGVLQTSYSGSIGNSPNTASDLVIGRYRDGSSPVDGLLDETRFSDVARSSNWIWAAYMTIASNDVFTTTGSAMSVLPTLSNDGGASNVTTTSAQLNVNLISTGAAPTEVTIYWGTSDGGTNASAWANTNYMGARTPGLVSTNVSSLADRTTYYYRGFASNSFGGTWAPPAVSFRTKPNTASWARRMEVSFSNYPCNETLTNFPALVKLSTNMAGFSYSDFQSGTYDDLLFTQADMATEIVFEIDTWNTSGTSTVWVLVPEITANTNTVWAFWGRSGMSQPASSTNGATWSNGYAAVWHMNSVNIDDSTGNDLDGVGGSGVSLDTGLAGSATDHDATSSAGIDVTDGFSSTIRNDQTHTFSLWYNVRNFGDVIIDAPDLGGLDFFLQFNTTVGFYMGYGGGYRTYSGMALQANEWEHVAFVKTAAGNSGDLYLNGVLQTTYGGSIGNAPDTASDLLIGRYRNGTNPVDGLLDEIRFSDVTRSSNWIWAAT